MFQSGALSIIGSPWTSSPGRYHSAGTMKCKSERGGTWCTQQLHTNPLTKNTTKISNRSKLSGLCVATCHIAWSGTTNHTKHNCQEPSQFIPLSHRSILHASKTFRISYRRNILFFTCQWDGGFSICCKQFHHVCNIKLVALPYFPIRTLPIRSLGPHACLYTAHEVSLQHNESWACVASAGCNDHVRVRGWVYRDAQGMISSYVYQKIYGSTDSPPPNHCFVVFVRTHATYMPRAPSDSATTCELTMVLSKGHCLHCMCL